MNNNKVYPFERNRYYSGKMLTSSDFQAEQTYFNNKRRFINTLMYGEGIVCGCGVFNLDDLSILVESGVAIDGLGREIVIESSVVKKLSAIDGFEDLHGKQAALCLRYKEDPVHAVYAMKQGIADDSQEYEYNRISEGYQLFLMDLDDCEPEFQMEGEFLTSAVLLENEDFLVKLVMPGCACKGRSVRLVVQVEKLSGENRKLSYQGVLQVPAFLTQDGGHEITIDLEDIALKQGECVKKEYWMMVQEASLLETSILLKVGTARAYVDGSVVEALAGVSMKVVLTEDRPQELINREIGRMSLEMRQMGTVKDYICLAHLKLVRTENAYIIEDVLEKDVKHYITAPAQEMLRGEYLEYFYKDVDILKAQSERQAADQEEEEQVQGKRGPEVATGVLEISLGESARKGDIFYSGEIMHGLGKGNVYVDIGYEYIADDPALGASSRNTVYGNPELFQNPETSGVDAETAVRVQNDKGSFVVAARLLKNVDYLVMTYRWVAIKFPSGNDLGFADKYQDKRISTDTPTVVLGTKESHYFHVVFKNMESCSVAYELTEPGSGEITTDGVYTAPAKEGVYEIRIYCIDMPIICTYAYAIVKKKGYDEAAE